MNRRIFAMLEGNVIRDFYVTDTKDIAQCIANKTFLNPNVVDATYYDCNVGDFFENGSFYRIDNVGTKSKINPEFCTDEHKIALDAALEDAKNRISALEQIIIDNNLSKLIN